MQKQTSPSREADNDVRDALESIVLQIEGPEEPRDTKVVSDAHGMVHLSEAVKDTMPPLFSSTMLVPTVGDALELTRGDVCVIVQAGRPSRTHLRAYKHQRPTERHTSTRALCETISASYR